MGSDLRRQAEKQTIWKKVDQKVDVEEDYREKINQEKSRFEKVRRQKVVGAKVSIVEKSSEKKYRQEICAEAGHSEKGHQEIDQEVRAQKDREEVIPQEEVAQASAEPRRLSERWLVILLIFASFFLFSAARTPPPGVNEPHYLCKAKQFWDKSWCRGDLFLESSDAHLVFYETVGFLTRFLTLEQSAWVGRALALALLAFGWNESIGRFIPGRWSPLWSAWLFLAIAAVGNLSGEWVIGGVEAKVIAYGFVLSGIAFLVSRRFNLSAICAGLAVSFHPIIGIWSLIAVLFATVTSPAVWSGRVIPPIRSAQRTLVPITLLVVCALPGLWPALKMLLADVPSETQYRADYIQVFYRLPHHLDPMIFSRSAYLAYAGLTIAWLIGRKWLNENLAQRWFTRFVIGTLIIAAVGMLLGLRWGSAIESPHEMPLFLLRLKLMKFYPFRLFDVFLPIAFSITAVGLARRVRITGSEFTARGVSGWITGVALFVVALMLPGTDRNPSLLSPQVERDWIASCRWIRSNTPGTALCFAPEESWAFKWYAHRPEYVAFKDCPQDASGIVEWNRRLRLTATWAQENYSEEGYSLESLQDLRDRTGIEYIITRHIGPFPISPVYENDSYRIYHLGDGPAVSID